VNDFNVYQRLLLIFIAVSVIELIFVPQCFIQFVQLVTLKAVVVNLASPNVS